jgi:hypothetical protein
VILLWTPRFPRPFCSFAGQQGGAVTAHRHGVIFLILLAVFFHLPLYVLLPLMLAQRPEYGVEQAEEKKKLTDTQAFVKCCR